MTKSKKSSKAEQKKSQPFFLKQNLLTIILSLTLISLITFTYEFIVADKFYPLTYIGSTNVSFLKKGEAIKLVQSNFRKRVDLDLQFKFAQNEFSVDLAKSSPVLDYSVIDESFKRIHSGTILEQIISQANHLIFPLKITPQIKLSLENKLTEIASVVDKQPEDAELIFDETPGNNSQSSGSARIQIKESINGLTLDKEKTEKEIINFLLTGSYEPQLPIKVTSPKITTEYVIKAKGILESSMTQPIKLVFENSSWTIDAKQLLTLLDLKNGQDSLLNKEQTNLYLKNIASNIDNEVQEGLFEFNPETKKVTAFKPSHEGRKLNVEKTFELITNTLTSNQSNTSKVITLPVEIVKPKISTSDVNSLGIKELLGRGISNFVGSIPNRIYNVGLTAVKINGVLIPPGEIFSFNKTVGDISAATGFKQAYVIKEGRTVLDDGGGVCQDSTTLFRAVLNAGLPVVKRTAHAYRVGYYEQGFPAGLDATVFYPSVDFQFKNDTGNHILLQAYTSGTTLYVDLYGTSDGRITNLTQPVISGQTPPPPELRQDDPTLPKGTVKQVDWAAWGANVSFKRTVTRNGETLLDEVWRSNYKPWQAVYLVGTKEN